MWLFLHIGSNDPHPYLLTSLLPCSSSKLNRSYRIHWEFPVLPVLSKRLYKIEQKYWRNEEAVLSFPGGVWGGTIKAILVVGPRYCQVVHSGELSLVSSVLWLPSHTSLCLEGAKLQSRVPNRGNNNKNICLHCLCMFFFDQFPFLSLKLMLLLQSGNELWRSNIVQDGKIICLYSFSKLICFLDSFMGRTVSGF